MYLAGVDIGGTKCAACIGRADGEQVEAVSYTHLTLPTTERV